MDRYGNNAQEAGTQRGKLARAKQDAWTQFRAQQIASRGFRTPYSNRALFESKLAGFDEQAKQIDDAEHDVSGWIAPMAGAFTSGVNDAFDQDKRDDEEDIAMQRYAQMYGGPRG